MKKVLPFILTLSGLLFADDYSFNFNELEKIEVKTYEYSGYIKGEQKHQILNQSSPNYSTKNKNSMDSNYGELFFNFKYFKNKFTIETELMANYENIDNSENDQYTVNQLHINYKYNNNHQVNIGKKRSKWGKGYFFNPVAFIDKKKDPNNPEASREGYSQINYKYNKVYKNDLKNFSFDAVYLRTTPELNYDLYSTNSHTVALKSYFLYKDIDIDILYLYNDKYTNRYGIDFSTNIKTNFEIHGEYGKSDDGLYSYLAGIKYLTAKDLTITSEYFYQNEQLSRTQSFWDKKYFINKFSQKEPLDILYLSVYYKNSYNLSDDSHQNNLGFIYTKIKNLDIDFSVGKNFGDSSSEFGSKLVDKFSWLQLKYSF